MSKPKSNNIKIKAGNVSARSGGVVGVDNSVGKSSTDDAPLNLTSPVGMLSAALKHLPFLWYAVGAGAILAIVTIVSRWHVPVSALVLGGLGLFVSMFGLVVFRGLVQPTPKNVQAPKVSVLSLWAFALLLVIAGFLSASSFFFNWPIPLRSIVFSR